jgi:hypothetical protein
MTGATGDVAFAFLVLFRDAIRGIVRLAASVAGVPGGREAEADWQHTETALRADLDGHSSLLGGVEEAVGVVGARVRLAATEADVPTGRFTRANDMSILFLGPIYVET